MSNSQNGLPPSPASKAIEFLAKVAGVVTCIFAGYTVYVTVVRDADQSQDKKIELKQKDADLFYKQNDLQRAKDAAKADFLQKNLPLLTSTQPNAMRQIEALIDATFISPDDALDVKTKARNIHASSIEPTPQANDDTGQIRFKTLGFQYANAGHFTEAALSFSNAISLAPKDAQALNALAYVQLRQGQYDEAYDSISKAIDSKPIDPKLGNLIIINAAKILCAQGKLDSARAYLNVALQMNPHWLRAAKNDGELLRLCEIKFN